jgi:hypothetical protein
MAEIDLENDIWEHFCPALAMPIRFSPRVDRCDTCLMPRPGPVREVMKYDAGKSPVDLIDPEFILGIGRVLAFGAKKYAPNGWKRGMAVAKVLAAVMRHTLARIAGEINDPETGLPHMHHAACELMFAAYYDRNSIDVPDDRFPKADK